MKKLSLYVFLGLLWCNVGVANDLKGKKLYCVSETDDFMLSPDEHYAQYSFEFTYFSKVKVIEIHRFRTKKFKENKLSYTADNNKITVEFPDHTLRINRKTLKTTSSYASTNCELVDGSVNLKNKMKKSFDIIKKLKTSKNKI